jgi:hypothetical protein
MTSRNNKVTIEITNIVTIRQGLVKRLMSLSDYAELADAIFSNPPESVIWQSQMTSEMVSGMTGDQIDEMTRSLDESVELTLDDYELEND